MTRTLGLFERLSASQLPEYLSGLIIGAEIVAGAKDAQTATVIGNAALTARYTRAAVLLDRTLKIPPENCTLHGQIALLDRWRAAHQ